MSDSLSENIVENVPQSVACEPQDETQYRWFAMRDLTRSNAKLPAYKMLGKEGLEVFTPMKSVIKTRNQKRVREEVPFLQDLLFVHATREQLDPIVDKVNTLQYRYQRGAKYCDPMVVANAEMERFIHAVNNSQKPRYYSPDEITPAMIGRKVMIVGGPLSGYEGNLLSLRGARVKRLMVSIPNFITVGVEVQPEFIQLL